MREFHMSFLVTAVCIATAGVWGYHNDIGLWTALWVCVVLALLEVSLSFDNAVVNAGVLKTMDEKWQRLFLTIGILIAVFGMRLVFPVVIVAVATGLGTVPVIQMALDDPDAYGRVLTDAYPSIAAFGGLFLLLVFFDFLFDEAREHHWLGGVERWLGSLGRIRSISVMASLLVLMATRSFLPPELADTVLFSGLAGVVLYLAVGSLETIFGEPGEATAGAVKRSGFAAFMYLEVLDASFSFDGVIGAFAITRDVVIIMLGLAIGAMFVRSMTVYLVHRGTLDRYIYLEHGAHYAIGVLAIIMLIGTVSHVPEVITGGLGVAFIVASVWSSVRHNRRQAVTLP